MQIISLSPSKIETFRKYFHEEYNGYITEEKVIESVIGKKTYSPQMMEGSAYHSLIENGPEKYYNDFTGSYEVTAKDTIDDKIYSETFEFDKERVAPVIAYRERFPDIVSEIPYTWKLKFNGVEVWVNLRIDAMVGYEIHDHKTTSKPVSFSSYENSLQHKIYLLATESRLFRYNIFEFKERVRSGSETIFHELVLFPSPSMKQQFLDMLDLYIRFCKDKNLMSYVCKNI